MNKDQIKKLTHQEKLRLVHQGKYLDILVNDEDPRVRAAVAFYISEKEGEVKCTQK